MFYNSIVNGARNGYGCNCACPNSNIFAILILLSILCISCKNTDTGIIAVRTPSGSGHLITLDYSKLKVQEDTLILPLSKFVENIEVIKLESSREAMTSTDIVFVSDNYILTYSFVQNIGCKLFKRNNGKYLRDISSRGRGPFEYTELYDVIMDESQGIFLLPWNSKSILQFDFEGKPVREIPLAYEVNKGLFELTKENTFIITIAPFRDMVDKFIWEQDFDGNVIHSVDAEPFFVHPDYGTELKQSYDNTSTSTFIFNFLSENDYIFHYDIKSGEIYPEFTVDYHDSEFDRDRIYYSTQDYYFGYFIDWERTPYYTAVWRDFFYVEKETLRGGYYKMVNDLFANLHIKHFNIRNNFYIGNYYPELLKDEINSYLSRTKQYEDYHQKRELEKFAAGLRRGGNNIIIIGKVKSEAL